MTNLEDIQKNTSEFNIEFHMKMMIAEAMEQTFLFQDNLEAIEDALKVKTSPYNLRSIVIGNMFSEVIKHYLGSSFDDEEGD